MRIALVHSFYRSDLPSGENEAVVRQIRLLEREGLEVALIARRTDDEARQPLYKARTAVRVATGKGTSPVAELLEFRPDLVHVHNLFPNFGDEWLMSWPGPVVATIHNYRAICANGLLFRDGSVCRECIDGTSLNAVRHGCYRGSRAASIPLTIANWRPLTRNRLLRRASGIIFLAERTRRTFVEAGAQPFIEKSVVIPNGSDVDEGLSGHHRAYWTFVGRLTEEKGLAELLRYWPESQTLVVIGDGPLLDGLPRQENIRFLGRQTREQVSYHLARSRGLILPSPWYEGFPLVISEACMLGTPVIARRGNAGADFAQATGAGRVYESGTGLRPVLESVGMDTYVRSRTVFETELSPSVWGSRLRRFYRSVLRPDGLQTGYE